MLSRSKGLSHLCTCATGLKWPMTGFKKHNSVFSKASPCPLLPSQPKICLQKTPCPNVSGGVVSAGCSLAEIGNVWYKSGAQMAPCRCALLSVSRLPWWSFVSNVPLSYLDWKPNPAHGQKVKSHTPTNLSCISHNKFPGLKQNHTQHDTRQ